MSTCELSWTGRLRQDCDSSHAADAFAALMRPEPLTLHQDPSELTAKVLLEGRATGALIGGNLDTIGRSVGWACPSFAGAILLIEDVDKHIGVIDRTRLMSAALTAPSASATASGSDIPAAP